MEEILEKVIELYKEIDEIPETDTLDDIKEAEIYEYEIRALIYDYCVSKNYNVDSFPEKYKDLIDNEDGDFDDFLDYDVKTYYVMKNALLHEDVFILVKEELKYYFEDFSDDNYRNTIQSMIAISEAEGVSLTFNREDNDYNPPKRQPPKLP